jgi:hypothetical protein
MKSINEFKKEMIEAFGEFELMATNLESGQVLQTKGWQPTPTPRVEINATEFIALGELDKRYHELQPGSLKNFLHFMKTRGIGEKYRGSY